MYSDSVFHEAETARLKLEMTCKQFEDSGPSTTLKAGFRRDKKQTRADEMLRPKIGDDFVQLKQYVDEQESKWKKQQISVSSTIHNRAASDRKLAGL